MRLPMNRATHDTVTPVQFSGVFPESPGNDHPTKECNDDDSETVRDRGAGPVPGFSGAGEGTVPLYHVRRARLDPDRGQRE